MTLADHSYWIYTYDRLGQVVSGKRYWQDGTPVAGQQFEYGFDDIGNRKTTATGGDAGGAGLRPASYGANLLNQYTNRTVPGTVDILGVANPTAGVTVNGNTAYRKGDYFWHPLSVNNTSAAQYPGVTTISQYGAKATNAGKVFLAKTPETFIYDADGNLRQDGRWDYTWDGENRLVAMQTRSAALGSGVPEQRLEFTYDPQSRRLSKTVSNRVSGAWNLVSAHRFLYDGWNLLAIFDPQSSILQSFTWGLDLSGTLQGAGGVGGLLWVNDAATLNNQPSTHAACYDGNGNVTALVGFSDASVSARYEYGPFGEPLRQTGPLAEASPFRFSTKFTDAETGLLYYGYRYYLPSLGRWLSRDPLLDEASLRKYLSEKRFSKPFELRSELTKLPGYVFAFNGPTHQVDTDGRISMAVWVTIGVGAAGTIWALLCADTMLDRINQANTAVAAVAAGWTAGYSTTAEGTPMDALQHCIGTCMAIQRPGCCPRFLIRSQRARADRNEPGDLANNAVGFAMTGDCRAGCVAALAAGGLTCGGTTPTDPTFPCPAPPPATP